ncbi:hypothetical protein Poli38472_004102 [Pythium oligandrum]|uniref:glucan endo-1,3-beta-D-glucosidase n=1 Tax=Pythium oligandrum TaxID=41045 RepID=A0A8K1CMM1_PYTOL|nr:hypothetical protein Poli38472_004102 [Pythium oligandrum]|eukprot:TMW66337.1 hypothetical protein Poli38472_004102 [Pythium oligandrum]
MKVSTLLRTAVVVAALLSATQVDAKKVKLCDADGHAPTPAPSVAPAPTTKTPPPTDKNPVAEPVATKPPQSQSGPVLGAPGAPAATGAAPTAAPSAAPSSAPAPPSGGQQTQAGNVKASFSYKGKDCGGPGSYNMVTDVKTCARTPHNIYSPVGPMSDDVTIVFRGPMTIHNIAVFDGSSGSWNKVSSYKEGGEANNLVFLNNRNIDYTGQSAPQGFAQKDGRGNAKESTAFGGELGGATNPDGFTIFGDEKTGAEVNIFQNKKCGVDAECKGYYDKDRAAMAGWAGGKKIFVTKVRMPHGGAPNLPAIWMLNGQVVRSNQYQCNCRGLGKAGGCGELDIAEVIEKDLNVVATHYYFYDGGSAPGHDSWGKRPVDAPATYVTVVDESFGIKVIELGADDFDFNSGSISQDVVQKWLA